MLLIRCRPAGTYYVTVTGNNGCTTTANTIISEPTALDLNIITIDATCGIADGIAIVSVSGGTLPYDYAWSSGDTTDTADSLVSGIHIVTVIDSNGCSNFAIATISDFGGPTIITNTVTDVTCNGFANGAIDISIIGGTAPFIYVWSSGDTTQDISGLPAGPYEIAISDANGCTANKSITVNEPAAINLTITTVDASCGNANGTAVVSVTGGTIPYTYNWSSGGMGYIETGLSAGVCAVVVTDSNNCIAIASAAISDTGAATITIDSILNEDCGSTGGSIYISLTGGATPYTYLWSNGASTDDLQGVSAGTYYVTVTGSNGCIATASATISGQLPSSQSICLVTVDSTSGKNLIVWEKTPGAASYNIYRETTQSGVYFLAGTVPYDSLSTYLDPLSNPLQKSYRYKISATDTCGNESNLSTEHKTMHLTINQGLGGDINLIWNHYDGFSFNTYYIYRYTTPTGWQVIDSIQSNLNSFTDFSPPTSDLWYQVVVKHPSVCAATLKANNYNSSKSNTCLSISAGTLTAIATATDATQDSCDGTAMVTAGNGNPPYTYLWNDPAPAQTTTTANLLCAGSYTVIVTDANGCADSITINITRRIICRILDLYRIYVIISLIFQE